MIASLNVGIIGLAGVWYKIHQEPFTEPMLTSNKVSLKELICAAGLVILLKLD